VLAQVDHTAEVELAYLASCQTAADHVQLLDETLNLAEALQLVGYQHVLAALWTPPNLTTPAVRLPPPTTSHGQHGRLWPCTTRSLSFAKSNPENLSCGLPTCISAPD
jgi:hypothetical protein